MGVSGDVLTRVLKTAGREIDLCDFAKGIWDCSIRADDVDGGKRQHNDKPKNTSKRQKIVRPLRIGVDVSTWIARASHGHGGMLVDERHLSNYGRAKLLSQAYDKSNAFEMAAESTRKDFVSACTFYVINKITKLQQQTKADLLIVLDGNTPPIKIEECKLRKDKRKDAAKMRDAPANTVQPIGQRIKAAKRAGAGSSHTAVIAELTVALRTKEIPFLVAPYEADGQLAYLSNTGMIDLVLTEDSDLLAYGIRNVMYKQNENKGLLIRRRDLGAIETLSKSLCLEDFSSKMIAVMFACVGCDYCNSLKGIGSVTARDIVKKVFNTKSEIPVLQNVYNELYRCSSEALTNDQKANFERRFTSAVFMYQHPLVFCPLQRRCTILGSVRQNKLIVVKADEELAKYKPYADLCADSKRHSIIGQFPPGKLQIYLAEGWIQPRTFQTYPNVATPPEVVTVIELYHNNQRFNTRHGVDTDGGSPVIDRRKLAGAAPHTGESSIQKDCVSPAATEQKAGESSASQPSSQETPLSKSSGSDTAHSQALVASPFSKSHATNLSILQQSSCTSQLSSTQASSVISSQSEIVISGRPSRLQPLICELSPPTEEEGRSV